MDVATPEQFIDLAVGDDHFIQLLGPHHSLAHHRIALHTPSVVGKTGDIGSHALQICHSFTLFAHGDGTVGIHMDDTGLFNELKLPLQMLNAVRHGI